MQPAKRAVRLALSLVVITSCQSSALPPPPQGSPVVVVNMEDYRYEHEPSIPAGRVVFRFVNTGVYTHRPSLLPLDEDVPPIDEQLQSSERRIVLPFAGVPDRQPGESGTFAVDLEPGRRYALICFFRDPDGVTHARKGMTSEFRAGGQVGPTG
jgi:hypothetical protein